MKPFTVFCGLMLITGFLSAQSLEAPTYPQGLGFSGGLTSGTGFTYRYLQDFGYSLSALAYYDSSGETPKYFYFTGGSVMKKLAYIASDSKDLYALLYGFWGVVLVGASVEEEPKNGLSVSSGPGFGMEFGFFQHLGVYFEVSQGATYYLIKPVKYSSMDAGPLFGTGIVYRF